VAAAASSMAAVIYSQDFSKGLQANETLGGLWSISNGKGCLAALRQQ
jgi:hypothetical protein